MPTLKLLVLENGWWVSKPLPTTVFRALYDDYAAWRVQATYTNPDGEKEWRSHDIKEALSIATINRTLEEAINDRIFDSVVSHPFTDLSKPKQVKFIDAYDFNYSLKRGASNYHPSNDVPEILATDLIIQTNIPDGSKGSIEYLQNNCLTVVNDKIWGTDVINNAFYIKNATDSIDHIRGIDIGLIDFSAFGGITKYPITTSNVRSISVNTEIGSRFQTTCAVDTGSGLTGKNVGLVIAGKLHILDNTYRQISSSAISFDIDHRQAYNYILNLPEKFRQRYIPNYTQTIGYNNTYFDFLSYLTAGDSFVFTFNGEYVLRKDETLVDTKLPGHFETYRATNDIFFNDDGTICNYALRKGNKYVYTLSVVPKRDIVSPNEDTSYDATPLNATGDVPIDNKIRYQSGTLCCIYGFDN